MKRNRNNNNQQWSSKGPKIKSINNISNRVRSIPTTYILPRNTKLYQSVSNKRQYIEKYPLFFANTSNIANIYLSLKSRNICKTFQTTSEQLLIILGRPSTELEKMINFLEYRLRIPIEVCRVFKYLSQIFFGNTDNINDVIIAINFLKHNKKLIKAMINAFNTDRTNSILSLKPYRIIEHMYSKLEKYLEQINSFKATSPTMTIMPSRITDRNWDSLFCNLLKQYFKRSYKGFIVSEYTQDQLTNFKSENIILFNELINGFGLQTPPEICLLMGYDNLVDLRIDCKQTPRIGGSKKMSALKIKIKKLKSERTKLKKKIKAAEKKTKAAIKKRKKVAKK